MNVFEGGNVFKDKMGIPLTQRINQADIPGTIQWLETVLDMDLSGDDDPDTGYPSRWLGSTGKKESSGDLDIAIDTNQASKEAVAAKLTQFVTSQGQDPREWVKKAGEVHFKTPINGDPAQGFVQTDFMFFPNVDWGTYYYGGGTDSAYKGVMRNVLVSSVAKSLGLKVGANGMFSRATNQLVNHGMDPDYVASVLLGSGHDRKSLKNVETIYNALSADPQRDAKLADFREYLQREGASEPGVVKENDVNFLARLRDRIVNQGMQAIVENPGSANPYQLYEAEAAGVGGRAKGIEHLEDLVFRKGSQGVREALAIIDAAAANPGGTTTVKWDGKPAIIFGRKPSTGEFVLTDGSGFEAKGYDGLATSVDQLAQFMNMRSGDRRELIQLYATLWPMLEAATPANFRGYVKGDLLYMDTPPEVSGNYVFQPNTVEYRIPAQSSLGQRIGASTVGIAMHSMYADQGESRQPLSRVKFVDVPGLLLIEPIYGNEITPNKPLIKEIKTLLSTKGAAIDTLFNPAELRTQQITDLAKLCVDYINYRIGTGHFENLLGEFGKWLQSKVSPRKFNNIIEYLKSPSSNTEGMAAAFTLFLLLHDLKMDVLQQLDRQSPGNEGWVMATPSGYAKAVNRFDFTARNRARNNPQSA
jgi:hypothetical protein